VAEFPSLPLFTDAYLADCAHLTDAEHGRYFQLLMLMWRSPDCRIPNDDEWLARKFRRSVEEVKSQLRPVIQEFCSCDGNWITQKRLLRERTYTKRLSKRGSDNVKQRWNKKRQPCQTDTTLYASGNAPTPTPIPPLSKNSPLPPQPAERPNGVGVLKNGNGGGCVGFDILTKLSPSGLEAAKAACQGWDVYYLASVYSEGVRNKSREPPSHPDKAFPAWIPCYTKGKTP